MTIKEIQAGYLTNIHFKNKNIYLYLAQISSLLLRLQLEKFYARKYLLLDSLIFRMHTNRDIRASIVYLRLISLPQTCFE